MGGFQTTNYAAAQNRAPKLQTTRRPKIAPLSHPPHHMGAITSLPADTATARLYEWAQSVWLERGLQRRASYARLGDPAAAALANKEELPVWAMQTMGTS